MSTTKETSVLELVINGRQAETSINGLTASVKKAEAEFRKMRQADDPKAYEQAARNIRVQKAALDEMRSSIRNVNQESDNFKTNWRDIAKGVIAGGIFQQGVAMLQDFGRQVVATYTEYEKFSTVLENSLGSKDAARRAMAQLQEFAAQTPFALSELTESYVKYVNRGIIPTMDEMRKLGDLASSQGKSFNQLTEAVLDATTGEFERLKEFGIRASKNGDMVALSFKGVTKEVKFTEEAIQSAILGFGEAEGVMGGMAKQSETLGGKISNLGDAWDQLLVTMGSKTGGILYSAVTAISDYLSWVTEAMKSTEQVIQESVDKAIGNNVSSLQKRSAKEQMEIIEGTKLYIADLEQRITDMDAKLKGQIRDRERVAIVKERRKVQQLIEIEKGTLKAYEEQEKQKADIKRKAEEEKARIEKNIKADAAEKEAKRVQKEAEHQRKQREKEAQEFIESYKNLLQKYRDEGLDPLDRIVEDITNNYDKLIKAAEKAGNSKLVADLKELRDLDVDKATGKFTEEQKKKDDAFVKDETDKAFKAAIDNNDAFYAQQRLALTKQYQQGLLDKEAYDAKLVELEMRKFEDIIGINQMFGLDVTAILQQQADFAISQKEREVQESIRLETEKKEFYINAAQQASDAIFQIIANSRQSQLEAALSAIQREREQELDNKNLSEAQKKKINEKYDREVAEQRRKAFEADRRASIAQAVINGALAVTKALAQTGVLAPFVIPTIIAGTAAQVAVIASQKAPKFKMGGRVDGPSHEQGGIKMVDGITGAVIGEMEGGETIISAEQSQRYPQTIDALLYGKQRSQNYNIAGPDKVIAAERFYRNGGMVPTFNPESTNSTSTLLSNDLSKLEALMQKMIEAQMQANDKQVVLSMRTFEEERARRVAIINDASS